MIKLFFHATILKISLGGKVMGSKCINSKPWWIAALSPFVYLAVGLWFGWWAISWIIIPASFIYCSKMSVSVKAVLNALLAYLFMGLMFSWWTQPWAWFMIPVTLIAAINNVKDRKEVLNKEAIEKNENAN